MRRPADKERSHGISFFTNHRRRNSELQNRRGRSFLCIPRHQSPGRGPHARGSEVRGGLHLRSRRPHVGRYDALRQKVAAAIRRETGCRKVASIVLGLEVPHAHIHLIPMNEERDVDFSREKLQLTPERFASIAERLREAVEI